MKTKSSLYDQIVEQIKNTVLQFFEDENVIIIQFGSSAKGDSHRYSDIDIGILPKNGYDKKKLIFLREQLENMNIPYSVDLVDISKVSEVFKENVLKEGNIWKT